MNGAEVASLAASTVSIGLAVFAIGLALFLFKWSSEQSVRANESANRSNASADRIDETVRQLQRSVERLERESFATVRDTLGQAMGALTPTSESDRQEAEQRVAEQVEVITKDYEDRFAEVAKRLEVADDTASELRSELRRAVGSAIEETRKAEESERQSAFGDSVSRLLEVRTSLETSQLAHYMTHSFGFSQEETLNGISRLLADGVLVAMPGNRVTRRS